MAIGCAALLFVACSGSDDPTTSPPPAVVDAGAADVAPDSPEPPREILPYPPGPYGPSVGDVMADFRVQGYGFSRTQRDSSDLPFRDVTVAEIRSDPSCKT
jgi:hypothetical protein